MTEVARTGRPARLDRPLIVTAAVALADEHGLNRLTMRSLAVVLEVTPAALYRHVRGREELIDLVLDEALADRPEGSNRPEVPSPSASAEAGGWRTDLSAFIRSLFAVHRAHPWLATGPYPTTVGPRTIATMNEAIALLAPHSADAGRAHTAIAILFQLVSGHARGAEAAHRLANQVTGGVSEDPAADPADVAADPAEETEHSGVASSAPENAGTVTDDYMIAVIIAAVGGILAADEL